MDQDFVKVHQNRYNVPGGDVGQLDGDVNIIMTDMTQNSKFQPC